MEGLCEGVDERVVLTPGDGVEEEREFFGLE